MRMIFMGYHKIWFSPGGASTDSEFGYFCYSIKRYKQLQNQLLHKPLQTVTNRYKQLQTSYSVNRYKSLRTVKNHLLHKPLQTVTVSVWHYGIAVSTVTEQSRNYCWHFSAMNVRL